METLVINIRNKRDSKLIRELLESLGVEVHSDKEELRRQLGKSRIRSGKELSAMGGMLRGQLINKEHLRSLSWKKLDW